MNENALNPVLTVQKSNAVVVVPVYRAELSDFERASFQQSTLILGKKHPIVLIAPEGIDLTLYREIYQNFSVEYFEAHNFASVAAYSRLLLDPAFYKRFLKYEWMLICQLDVWVLKDDLDFWCTREYDFLGAPIPCSWEFYFGKTRDITGNGGFSLRKISKVIQVLEAADAGMYSKTVLLYFFWRHLKGLHFLRALVPLIRLTGIGNNRKKCLEIIRRNGCSEDMIFHLLSCPEHTPFLKMPSAETAAAFALDGNFLEKFEYYGRKVPFGIHAYHKNPDHPLCQKNADWDRDIKTVSVIIPALNSEKFLAETLESVKQQTFTDWECIIVDDGSTDETWNIAGKYCSSDRRFIRIKQTHCGVSCTRNNGIKHASGKYILPLDSDDVIGEKYMEKAVKIFEESPGTSLVYCKAAFCGTKKGDWELPEYSYRALLLRNLIFISAFFRKSDFGQVKGYSSDLHILEDWDFYIRLLNGKSKVVRIDDVMFFYRQQEDNSSQRYSREEWAQVYDHIVRLHWKKYLRYHFLMFFRYFCHYEIIGRLRKIFRGHCFDL